MLSYQNIYPLWQDLITEQNKYKMKEMPAEESAWMRMGQKENNGLWELRSRCRGGSRWKFSKGRILLNSTYFIVL